MTRINTNIASLIAQNNLARSHSDLAVRLERLSTGLRINKGADDPAGLIVSERLRSARPIAIRPTRLDHAETACTGSPICAISWRVVQRLSARTSCMPLRLCTLMTSGFEFA